MTLEELGRNLPAILSGDADRYFFLFNRVLDKVFRLEGESRMADRDHFSKTFFKRNGSRSCSEQSH